MDQAFWNSVGGASNLGHAYRLVLRGLGYPVTMSGSTVSDMEAHPVGNEEIDSAEEFAIDFNEVVRKNPQAGLTPLASTFGLDLSDARYNALQTAVELVDAENVAWPDIVQAARNKVVAADAAVNVERAAPIEGGIQGGFPQPDPGDGPPGGEGAVDGESESAGGGTLLLGLGVAAAAAFLLMRR